jgi:S-DNA-T family DNA segregation ATPase FtsK/SpoIIIE
MAENTYKADNTPLPKKNNRTNTASASKKAAKADPQPEETEKGPSAIITFFKDRRFHLVSGMFIMLFSFALLIAFTSFLFSGRNDQSIVEALWNTSVQESGKEVDNLLGIVGAALSYIFIYKWFGMASYLFLPIFFFAGYKIVYQSSPINISTLIKSTFFFLLWISSTLGFVVLTFKNDTYLSFLSGGIGYDMAEYLDNIIGWGTPFLLLFFMLAFMIYFFNITKMPLFGAQNIDEVEEINGLAVDETEEEEEEELAEEGEEEIEELEEEEIEELEEEELEEEETEEEEEEWVIERKEPVAVKGPSELQIETPIIEPMVEPVVAASTGTDDELALVVEKGGDQEAEDLPENLESFNYDPTLDLSSYKYPTFDLLNEYDASKVVQVSKEELSANKDKIVETLSHYNIGIASIKATIGPTVTLYEIVPEVGIRISKIKNLEDDIALSLSALGIRIIAPIPGKGTIGIEVPNKNKEMVSMRSVLSTEKFMKSDKELPVVFGKTVSNEVFVVDLAELPHLLIAGATGQGKSVGLNVLLASLLYKKHPSQLKLVLVDPKKVELTLFNKIERHFLAKLPDGGDAIITDTKKVIHTLNSLCVEMDLRYDLLKDAQVRNIREYNKKFVERKLNPNNGHRFLPYIVLVIDELADLMMTAGKEVETPIARLAQLARAIGIHLVVATQRPSVNVITGIIKANFPARLSFKVSSKIDSRTILDAGGADQLIGKGDMLFAHGDMVRLQCAFLDTAEVERICEFIGSQRGYEMAYKLPEFSDDETGQDKSDFNFSEKDPLFEEAAKILVMHQQGSTSLLQRKLKLGYNRAGRLIDQLEAAGIVGQFEGSKAREVLIKDEYSLEFHLKSLDQR